jgi:hypothetical protein
MIYGHSPDFATTFQTLRGRHSSFRTYLLNQVCLGPGFSGLPETKGLLIMQSELPVWTEPLGDGPSVIIYDRSPNYNDHGVSRYYGTNATGRIFVSTGAISPF